MVFDLAHGYQRKKHLKHSSVSYIFYQSFASDTKLQVKGRLTLSTFIFTLVPPNSLPRRKIRCLKLINVTDADKDRVTSGIFFLIYSRGDLTCWQLPCGCLLRSLLFTVFLCRFVGLQSSQAALKLSTLYSANPQYKENRFKYL